MTKNSECGDADVAQLSQALQMACCPGHRDSCAIPALAALANLAALAVLAAHFCASPFQQIT